MRNVLKQVSMLSWAGWFDLTRLAIRGAVVEVGIRRRPLPAVARYCRCRLTGSTHARGREPLTIAEKRRQRLVGMLYRWWPFTDPEGACLRRSLLLGWVLRSRDPILRIGVARTAADAEITAHAWLEVQGVSIGADGYHSAFSFGTEVTE